MSGKINVRDTKNMFELLIDKKITITLKNQEESKIVGVLLHHTQFEILIKSKVSSSKTGEVAEKIRIIPKHSILIAKEK